MQKTEVNKELIKKVHQKTFFLAPLKDVSNVPVSTPTPPNTPVPGMLRKQ